MRLGNVASDAQPQSRTTAIPVTRRLDTEERLEYLLQEFCGNAGPFIPDADDDLRAIHHEDMGTCAVLDGVVQEVSQAPLQRFGLRKQRRRNAAFDGDFP